MAVRSTALGSGTAAAATTVTVFTVPADTTVLVKSVLGYCGAGGTTNLVLRVFAIPPASSSVVVATIDLVTTKAFRWEAWLALDPGYRFQLNNQSNAAVNYHVSGTVLPGVAVELVSSRPA